MVFDGNTPICLVCRKPAIKREKNLYCSADCRKIGRMNFSSEAIRQVAFERDGGVCAETGINCYFLEKIRAQAHKPIEDHMIVAFITKSKRGKSKTIVRRRTKEEAESIQLRWRELWKSKILRLDIPERLWKSGSLWHADHIIPVFRGGGVCDRSNIQTLSWKAHSEKTILERKGSRMTGRNKMDYVLGGRESDI